MRVQPVLRVWREAPPPLLLYVCQQCGTRSREYGSKRLMNLNGSTRSEIRCRSCRLGLDERTRSG